MGPLVAVAVSLVLQAGPTMGGLDLPVTPVRLDPGTQTLQWGLTFDDDGDDPRDTPPPVFYGEEIESESDSLVIVLDASGSMEIDDRWQRAEAETIRAIQTLSKNFRFNLVIFNSVVHIFKASAVEATARNKQEAITWIRMWYPYGFTATGPATAQALSDRTNMAVVLLTDGLPNWGLPGPDQFSRHRIAIITANVQGATIDVFGVSTRGRTRAFCQAVASDSGGSYVDIP